MPKKSESSTEKQPGRFKQMWQVFKMTREYDPQASWIMLTVFLVPVALAVVLSLIFSADNPLLVVLWVVAGVLVGILAALIVMGRRAERVAYSQIEGRPGAVGAVLSNSLGRAWAADDAPVAVNPKTQDAVYRAVGRAGVALVGEGPEQRVSRLLDDERKRVSRVVPNVQIISLTVGTGPNAISLGKLPKTLKRTKKTLSRSEMLAVNNRLASLKSQLPIPKGIDPLRMRPQRAR